MSKSKRRRQPDTPEPSARDRHLKKMASTIRSLARSLHELDPHRLDEVVKAARRYPAAARRKLFQLFEVAEPAIQAVLALVLKRWADADVVDNLNGLVFDDAKDDLVRVRAAELLADLGHPIDPDVLAMSVSNAKELAANLPAAVWEKLASAEPAEGAAALLAVDAPFRLVIVHRLVEEKGESAMRLLAEAVGDESVALAAAFALGRTGKEFAVALLGSLEEHPSRKVQKIARRSLFALKAAGVKLPEPQPKPREEAPAEPADDELPLFRALILDETKRQGVHLAAVARERPDGYLKVVFVVVDLYKRGIRSASCRLGMSKSAFRRRVETPDRDGSKMRAATLEECQKLVARGLRATQILGGSMPYDFQVGRRVLGDIEPFLAEFENPFLCESCGAALPESVVERIREVAAYEHIPVEPFCESCRKEKQ